MHDIFHQILKEKKITSVFQPIVDLRSGEFVGYEGLVRVPHLSNDFVPATLFQTARELGRLKELEELCCRLHVLGFLQQGLQGKLFLNSSPDVVLMLFSDLTETPNFGLNYCTHLAGLDPQRIVMELTETERADNYHDLNRAIAQLRSSGLEFAIDDLGEGYSCLRLWSELQPEYVKIDRHFVSSIDTDVLKQQLVRSICDIAEHANSIVVAEGIETAAELQMLQHIGVRCGQGYFLARPAYQPHKEIAAEIKPLFGHWPRASRWRRPLLTRERNLTAAQLLQDAPAVEHTVPTNQVYELFQRQASLQSVVVLKAGVPLGILRRAQLYDQWARLYHRELYGNKPCSKFIQDQPLIVDIATNLLDLGEIVAQGPQHYMSDGFIITQQGVYAGVGSSAELMREITRLQMHTARYANPLTQLPGNVPINEHLDFLLRQGTACAVCYVDLDNFKPYNDLYGYRKGDDVLQVVATLLQRHACEDQDFVGHVGGDDFIIIFRSPDWRQRCQQILDAVPQVLRHLYRDEHVLAGGYIAEDRKGMAVFHTLIHVSLGIVVIDQPALYTASLVADLASAAKAKAKKMTGNAMHIEQRHPLALRQALE
ncbi:GGDEF domain-containing protein [Alcaligenes endophyticus]|uniref:GGDEF domain-containing protein n=1 Tax=Alcaligenes endophyticus TaxID=1929088 RepID=A0ABT8ELJ0_9BURK|nr:GGDEF domain-containing protein [Alcaligenes endophyticus]MCX5591279.1 GGDEF domain-containing protein [Alcaligenes endophyticus]MDN4122143.1 GGDEF domain-containing protein [Alcaligenes endophyticus]